MAAAGEQTSGLSDRAQARMAFILALRGRGIADVAVLRALGASTRYLLRDAIGQAGVVLGVGVGLGTALAAGAGLLAAQVMPVVVDLSTTLVPAVVLVLLGGLGAVLAVTRVARVDPHAALAAR